MMFGVHCGILCSLQAGSAEHNPFLGLEDWPGKGEEPGAAQRFDHIGMENQHEASEGTLSRV